ncbi:MAG: alpha/beta hydrolase [Azoarcus sp.]|jgi:fermentation-respiration switch protein FrsA (DUF1100 family)|nr:alpha/beta hydrolase [Azoarcus sp.]
MMRVSFWRAIRWRILFCAALCMGVFLYWVLPWVALDMFYHPGPVRNFRTPQDLGLAFEDVFFSSDDGTQLHGWYMPAVGESRGAVLHVHGNAGTINDHLTEVDWLPREHYSVFMFDYRRYGQSGEGAISPKTLMEDTVSALIWLRQREGDGSARIFGLGQSLGGNNLVAALAHGQEKGLWKAGGVTGVVLDATFDSYSAVASDTIPGAGWLLNDSYSANRFIQRLAPTPFMIVHGDRDAAIPWQHSQRLFDLALPPKQIYIVPGAGHLGALKGDGMREKVLQFFAGCLNFSESGASVK